MKLIIVALALVAMVAASPVPEIAVAANPVPSIANVVAVNPVPSIANVVEAILRSSFNQEADGGYQFGFETEKGIVREETGQLKDVPDEENKLHPVVVMRGTYSYINADNKVETVSYYADETGFHAEGESIPKQAA